MKYVIMIIIALAAAAGIMLAAYGKKGLKYRKDNGANDYITAILLAVLVFFWGLDLISFIQSSEIVSSMSYIYVFGAPILVIVWIVYSRVKLSREMKAPPKPYKQK